ncbi:WD repeat-containing protein 62-like [Phaenicophaeus curvirostris]|uniref:WD repeat-containing protein 62-like n=1 Tax=Phaenicophaeus curvirostris TaxID=33595 RepID=UPI0037F0C43C
MVAPVLYWEHWWHWFLYPQARLELVLGCSGPGACAGGRLGLVAGCVVVVLDPQENSQRHILSPNRKALSAVAFSPDGKFLVTGEHGHRPAVRVWDVEERSQVSALHGHKHGVACVAFSTSARYLVSVGHPHDMVINVWDWKKDSLVASNKVSCRVMAVAFSEDSYFVTVGHRHVKFWFLDSLRELKTNETVPLVGRSGLLGDLHDNVFCGVGCGRGRALGSTFCISSSGLLCRFNQRRVLEERIALKVPLATCLCLSEDLIFCGCSDGTVRIFQASDLRFLGDLPTPHPLGVDITQPRAPSRPDLVYPDTITLAYDASNCWVTCIYKDHSVYVWDIRDLQKIKKVWSDLFHSSIIWNVEVYPVLEEKRSRLPPGSFLTCSSDNTIRVWTLEKSSRSSSQDSAYSTTLQNIIYVDKDPQHLQDSSGVPDRGETVGHLDIKSGVRVMQVSPDGEHLASGDRGGTIRIHELRFLQEVVKVEAHDSEVLCLEYSKPETGAALLASASRDGLIHVLNIDRSYELEQTLDDHSSAVTALRFAGNGNVQLISCGADKSVYFRHAHKLPNGFSFLRTHHVAEKTTLYDMDIDRRQERVTVACQDRNIRVYSMATGKLRSCYKGSHGDDGSLLKVHLDPSATLVATSCSDKTIALLDFRTGDLVAKLSGHSEIVTGLRFSTNGERLITVSGDSCIFIWRLSPELTARMRHNFLEFHHLHPAPEKDLGCSVPLRRETYMVPPDGMSPSSGASQEEEDVASFPQKAPPFSCPPGDIGTWCCSSSWSSSPAPVSILTNGRLPLWAKRLLGEVDDGAAAGARHSYRPQGRWAEQVEMDPIKTLPEVKPPYFTPVRSHPEDEVDLEPRSLELLLAKVDRSPGDPSEDFQLSVDEEADTALDSPTGPSLEEARRHRAMEPPPPCPEELRARQEDNSVDDEDSPGTTRAVEETLPESSSVPPSPEERTFLKQHFETLAAAPERFNGSLRDLKPPEAGEEEKAFIFNPRLSISARFLLRCQKNGRLAVAFPARPRSPVQTQEVLGKQPTAAEELQEVKRLDEKRKEMGEELGVGKAMGSHLHMETFTTALELLRLRFQEMLGFYDQVCAEATEWDVHHARTVLAGLFGWMKMELRSRDITSSTDTGTNTAALLPLDPETLGLLRIYSDSLVEMVRRRLEGSKHEPL